MVQFQKLTPAAPYAPATAERDNEAAKLERIDAAASHCIDAIAAAIPAELHTAAQFRAIARVAIAAAIRRHGTAGAIGDGRSREWCVKAAFWSADNGRDVDRLEMEGETTLRGFEAVAMWLRDGAAHVFRTPRHGDDLPADCTAPALMRRLDNLRPTLSRRAGVANMRHKFVTARGEAAFLQATITRVGADVEHALSAADDAMNDAATAAIRRSGALPYGPEIEGA